MIYLFIHQNFPGQYRHLVRHLADQPGNTVYFISQANATEMPGVHKITYTPTMQRQPNCHALTVELDNAIRRGVAVADMCRMLKTQGIRPDVIVGHSGWGETLFVKDVFPETPVLAYFEFYYHPSGVDLDFDPEFTSVFRDSSHLRTRNAINLMAFDTADWGHTPTRWQQSLYPPELRRRLTVIHEGVDTEVVKPDPRAVLALPQHKLKLTAGDEIITYVARNLEPYRGFHTFMRALPRVLARRPKARVLIVGGDGVSYGAPAAPRSTYRQAMLEELGDALDLKRVHFLGQVDYQTYLKVLQVSSAHVYLTYPFVLSWSFIEAMSAGCLMIGSRTPPVMEVLKPGVNGLAVDFFSPAELAAEIEKALAGQQRLAKIRKAARSHAVREYDLRTRALPQWTRLLKALAGGKRPTRA